MVTEPYNYVECGLDYVRLANGFAIEETLCGRGVAINNADQLHAAIAQAVVTAPQALRGQELRFLRAMLDLSQAALGEMLGKSRASIARWEGALNDAIPGEADRLLRLFYALKTEGDESAREILDLLSRIGEQQDRTAIFRETKGGWKAAA